MLPSDSRVSCRRHTDDVFYDRVAAALQGLGGRVLETPRSFLAIECEPNSSNKNVFSLRISFTSRFFKILQEDLKKF